MCGSDDQAADYFFWGVRGWLAGTANVLPRQHVELLEAANSGDHERARRLFEHLLPWLQHMEAGGLQPEGEARPAPPRPRLRRGACRPSCPSATRPRLRWSTCSTLLGADAAPAPSTTAIEVHAEGEQGTCYLGLPFDVPGRTAAEKLHHLNCVDDTVRRILTHEPRGRPQASANLVFPPSDPRADAAFVVLQADRAHAMSGSNTICVVTALLETGTLPMTEPTTRGHPRDGGRAGRAPRRPAGTDVASGSRSPACRRSSRPSTCRSRCPASGRSPSTWPTAAASTSSSTPPRSGSGSPGRRPATWSSGPSW